MRQVSAILLLLIFSFSFTGSFVVFKFQQYQLRKEIVQKIKAGNSKEKLSKIVISEKNKKDLTWKDSEEFSYKGMMYDVVYVEKTPNATIYHCLTDKQETKLISEFNKETKKKKNEKNRNDPPVKIAKVISKINPLPQKENSFSFSEKLKRNFTYLNHYTSLKLDILSPPPKIV